MLLGLRSLWEGAPAVVTPFQGTPRKRPLRRPFKPPSYPALDQPRPPFWEIDEEYLAEIEEEDEILALMATEL